MRHSENIIQTLGPLGWVIAVLLLVLICAAIVLAAVATRALLMRMRLAEAPGSGRAAARSVGTAQVGASNARAGRGSALPAHAARVQTGSFQAASPVPPENPHSPPTPPLGSPRGRG